MPIPSVDTIVEGAGETNLPRLHYGFHRYVVRLADRYNQRPATRRHHIYIPVDMRE
jgi:hypothetical protein